MEIVISKEAVDWYKRELAIEDAAYIRFYVRYGGMGGHIPGFSLGINLEAPTAIHTFTSVDNLMFYIEDADAWYFDGKNLIISMDENLNEPQFTYQAA